jgi:hypothetical protein
LEKLAPKAGISAVDLSRAVASVKERIADLNESVSTANEPSFTGPKKVTDQLEDAELQNLFLPLLECR